MYVPIWHAAMAMAPLGQKKPGAQGAQDVALGAAHQPGAQHRLAPVLLYKPTAQGRQERELEAPGPAELKVFAGQGVQAALPLRKGLKNPGKQVR